jgi:hypothetical protein
MNVRVAMCLIFSLVVFTAHSAWGFQESDLNNFFGGHTGSSNTTGDLNSFFGGYAGYSNTTGNSNSFFGYQAGNQNTTGYHNSFFGVSTGFHNIEGLYNSFFGGYAKLYISNSDTDTPLIYGEFDTQYLEINGSMVINDYIQLDLTGGSPPPTDDCNEPAEYGRMKVDEIKSCLYICVIDGWKALKHKTKD